MELLAKAVNGFCKKPHIIYMTMSWICRSHFSFLISSFYVYWLKVFQGINPKASAWKVFSCSHLGFLKKSSCHVQVFWFWRHTYSTSDNVTPPISRVLIVRHLTFCWWCHQCAVTRLENVRQSNIRRGKKAGFSIVTQTPSIAQLCFNQSILFYSPHSNTSFWSEVTQMPLQWWNGNLCKRIILRKCFILHKIL